MTEITLIGEDLAEEGLTFTFGGNLSSCQSCEIKNSCCGLSKNRWYKIVKVRENSHDCKVHHGKVKVVEVEEVPIETTISGERVIEGSVMTLDEKECDNLDCENFRLCHPPGVEYGGQYNVEDVGKKIDCPGGRNLKKVKLL